MDPPEILRNLFSPIFAFVRRRVAESSVCTRPVLQNRRSGERRAECKWARGTRSRSLKCYEENQRSQIWPKRSSLDMQRVHTAGQSNRSRANELPTAWSRLFFSDYKLAVPWVHYVRAKFRLIELNMCFYTARYYETRNSSIAGDRVLITPRHTSSCHYDYVTTTINVLDVLTVVNTASRLEGRPFTLMFRSRRSLTWCQNLF